MSASPDQFQRRVRVRLPFADRYLDTGPHDKRLRRELRTAFANPLCTVPIAKGAQAPNRGRRPPAPARAGHRPPHPESSAKTLPPA